jgi:hypothetical protein
MAPARPFTALWATSFIVLSAYAMWKLRFESSLSGVPVGFNEAVLEDRKLTNGAPLVTRFTTVDVIDRYILSLLVAAFMPGVAGWDPEVRLLQIYFLGNLFALICVWNVEANRQRNRWRLISL